MATKSANPPGDTRLPTYLLDHARQIWLAGLGAFAKAEQEGSKLFETLVQRGEEVEARLKKTAEDKVEVLRSRAGDTRERANDTWNKLEQVFQDRVARALARLGVPTRDDVHTLAQQVAELQENIAELLRLEASKAPVKRTASPNPVVVETEAAE